MNENDTQQAKPSSAQKYKADFDEASRTMGQQIRGQLGRADFLIFKGGRPGRIGELVSLGPHDGDDYIAEEIQRQRGTDTTLWRVVVGGKLISEASRTQDYALLIYLAAKNEPSHGTNAARYAARVLSVPNGWDD